VPRVLTRLIRPGIETLETASWDEERYVSRRARTLEHFLVRSITSLAVVAVFFVLLGVAGVHWEPLVASAGLVGVAVAFGAQTIVRDALSGVFILAQGPYNIGDYVRLNGTEGTVAQISLRSTLLVTDAGVVHTVPNGAIALITNFTPNTWRHSLTVSVKSGVLLDTVKQAVADVAAQVAAAPELGEEVIAGPQVRGITALRGGSYDVELQSVMHPSLRARWPTLLNGLLATAFERHGVTLA
jgi:moderate conductance mechanosensitive channel